jgi:hypothetical protein
MGVTRCTGTAYPSGVHPKFERRKESKNSKNLRERKSLKGE